MELMATRMAQYSLSPPANPVQIRTFETVSTKVKIKWIHSGIYHCNTSCDANNNEPIPQSFLIREEGPGQPKLQYKQLVSLLFACESNAREEATYHEQGGYDPVHYQTEQDLDPERLLAE
jgi:Aspartate carbamoyltransferase, regulatory subunit